METVTTFIKKQYSEETHNIYNVGESTYYNIENHRCTYGHYYNKKQFITNNLTNYITKRNSINNTENVLNIKKTFLRRIT